MQRLGIEWELQIVDSKTFDLADGAELLLHGSEHDEGLSSEAFQSCIELKTSPVRNTFEAENQFRSSLHRLRARAHTSGLSLCSLGAHPFNIRAGTVTPGKRYLEFAQEYPYITHHHLTFATHLHVSMDDTHQMLQVMNRLRPYLPLLMALSASCPFWRGEATGFVSFRQYQVRAAQNAGMPPYFSDLSEFEKCLSAFRQANFIGGLRDLHWDIRPRPDLGTLELRVMDAVPGLKETMALCSLGYCLISALKANTELLFPAPVPHWAEKENHFQASHLGLEASFIFSEDGASALIKDLLEKLLHQLAPHARELGEAERWPDLEAMLADPPYQRCIATFQKSASLVTVVEAAVDELNRSSQIQPELKLTGRMASLN
jgi:glutamate---cysteine ligase / carboxylate-amine ligase